MTAPTPSRRPGTAVASCKSSGWPRWHVDRTVPSADNDSVIAEVSDDLNRPTESFDVGLDRGPQFDAFFTGTAQPSDWSAESAQSRVRRLAARPPPTQA